MRVYVDTNIMLADADCIVTRNKKDFKDSSLAIYTANELFEEFTNEQNVE